MINKEIFLALYPEKPWQETNGNTARCGYSICEEIIPCSDCPWWNEEKGAKKEERIFITEMAKNEIDEIGNFDIDKLVKEKMMSAIEDRINQIDLSQPVVSITDVKGNIKDYNTIGIEINKGTKNNE